MGTPLTPYNSSESKKEQVATMFNNVAGTYDFLNHFFSMGIDKLWRRRLVKLIGLSHPKSILDVATGTADLAIAETRLQPEKIIGIDISLNSTAIYISEKDIIIFFLKAIQFLSPLRILNRIINKKYLWKNVLI